MLCDLSRVQHGSTFDHLNLSPWVYVSCTNCIHETAWRAPPSLSACHPGATALDSLSFRCFSRSQMKSLRWKHNLEKILLLYEMLGAPADWSVAAKIFWNTGANVTPWESHWHIGVRQVHKFLSVLHCNPLTQTLYWRVCTVPSPINIMIWIILLFGYPPNTN